MKKENLKIVKAGNHYYPHRIRTTVHDNIKKKFSFEDFPHLDLVLIKYSNGATELINDL